MLYYLQEFQGKDKLMKHIRLMILCIIAAIVFNACTFMPPASSQRPTLNLLPETTAAPTTTETTVTIPTQQLPPVILDLPIAAITLPVTTQTICAKDGTPIFYHTFQGVEIHGENPQVVSKIAHALSQKMDNAAMSANDVYSKAQEDYTAQTNWTPYLYQSVYTPMRIDRMLLSISGSHIIYDGNAHPYDARDSVTYSMITGNPLSLQQILTPECTAKKLGNLITSALSNYGDILFGDYPYIVEDCLRGLKGTVDNWYLSEKGLCFYFAPYEIAPYSVGTVTAEIPYEKLIGILSEDFFPPEVPEVSGEVFLSPLKEIAPGQIKQYVEVILDETQASFVLDTNGSILRVALELGALDKENFVAEATVFASESLVAGTGIAIQIPLEKDSPILRMTYISSGEEKTVFLIPDASGSTLNLIKF